MGSCCSCVDDGRKGGGEGGPRPRTEAGVDFEFDPITGNVVPRPKRRPPHPPGPGGGAGGGGGGGGSPKPEAGAASGDELEAASAGEGQTLAAGELEGREAAADGPVGGALEKYRLQQKYLEQQVALSRRRLAARDTGGMQSSITESTQQLHGMPRPADSRTPSRRAAALSAGRPLAAVDSISRVYHQSFTAAAGQNMTSVSFGANALRDLDAMSIVSGSTRYAGSVRGTAQPSPVFFECIDDVSSVCSSNSVAATWRAAAVATGTGGNKSVGDATNGSHINLGALLTGVTGMAAQSAVQSATEAALITADQLAFIYEEPADGPGERLQRLQEVEESRRSDIVAAFSVAAAMLDLAGRKVRPLVRVTRSMSAGPLLAAASQQRSIDFGLGMGSSPTCGQAKGDGSRHVASVGLPGDLAPVPQQHAESNHRESGSPEARPTGAFSPTSPREEGDAGAEMCADERTALAQAAAIAAAADVAEARAIAEQAPTGVQVLGLNARGIEPGRPEYVVIDSWDFLSQPEAAEALCRGDALFAFGCKTGLALSAEDRAYLSTFVNATGFKDEHRENNVPHVDAYDMESIGEFTNIMVKAMYLLPGVRVEDINALEVAGDAYQKACQPSNVTFYDTNDPLTFRCSKPLVRFVFSIIVQMKCSEVTDPAALAAFTPVDGMTPAKAIILERTKRDVSKVDSTAKVKSVLLYHRVTGGLLVSHATIVVNRSIPKVVAAVVNNFGSRGGGETVDVVVETRKYLLGRFGDHRETL